MNNLKIITIIIANLCKILILCILLILPSTVIARDYFVEWQKRNLQVDISRGLSQGRYPVEPIDKNNKELKSKDKSANKKIANKKPNQSNSNQPSQNSRQAKVGNYQPNKSFNQSNKQKLSNKNSNKAIQNKNFGLYFDLAFDSNIAAKDIKKIDFNNNFNTVIMFEFKSEYFEFKSIEGAELFNNNNNLIYNINLGLEIGSKYLGYFNTGYDKLLTNKFVINNYNLINWQYIYQNNRVKLLSDDYFLKTYYKTPSIFGLILYGEFAINDSKTSQYTKYFSNKNTLSIVDNIVKTNILETQNLNNAKYFNYKLLSDKETAYIIDFGINYQLDINTKTKQNNSFHLEIDVSAILARVKPEISTQILENMQDFLNISEDDFNGKLSDRLIKINLGFAIQQNMNALLLDSINISGGYSWARINSAKFAYAAYDSFNIITKSLEDSLSDFASKNGSSSLKPNLFDLGWRVMVMSPPNYPSASSQIIMALNNNADEQGLGGAEGFINQFTLEQLFDSRGSDTIVNSLAAQGKIKYYQPSCDPNLKNSIKDMSIELFKYYSEVLYLYARRNPFFIESISKDVSEYEQQTNNYDQYINYITQKNKVDIKKYSKTMHHIVNGSIKLEKFGLFISTSANYMMGEQAIYKNNGLFDSAEFIKYSVMRVGASVGYEFKDLIVASDSLNLYINSHYNSKEFIDKDSEYVFGIGIRYDL